MPITPQNAIYAEIFHKQIGYGPDFNLEACRAMSNGGFSPQPRTLIERCEDTTIPADGREMPIRIYYPRGEPLGVLVYFHGGGFVMGGLNTSDGICCLLSHGAQCVTVSVDYRLAPEHPFPAGTDDAYAAKQWIFANADRLGTRTKPVAVGGDSAGGTLATVSCMMSRDRGAPGAMFQVLFYPGININHDTPERRAAAEQSPILNTAMLAWLRTLYANNAEALNNPYCAPFHATDLSGLPPAFIVAGEYDPLLHENRVYAERLSAAGVETLYREYPGAIHGFASLFELIPEGRQAIDECAHALRSAFERHRA